MGTRIVVILSHDRLPGKGNSATGGPDSMRGIYPLVAVITESGYRELDEADIAERFERVLAEFSERDPAT